MPAYISPDFITLLFNLFTGAATAPSTVYMGLGSEVSTTDGGNPAQPSGYSRLPIQTSSLTVSGGTLTIPAQTWNFTATPSPTNTASLWFVSDSASGGKTLFSGPLNSGAVSGTLIAASGYGLTISASSAAGLMAGDVLRLGSTCSNNLEYVGISEIDPDGQGNTLITLVAAMQHPHPPGEAWSRDGSLRQYSAGFTETVSAAVQIVSG